MTLWKWLKVMLHYFLPFIQGCPQMGNSWDADCLFVQAFGRNSITDKELGEFIARTLSHSAPGDNKSAFDRLSRGGFRAGAPNRAIAQHIIYYYGMSEKVLFLQWEVAYSIFVLDPGWYKKCEDRIVVLWPPKSGYFSTYDVKKASVEEMKKRGLKLPVELAHPSMVVRAVLILWRLGVNPVVYPVRSLDVWDSSSIQPWTRNRAMWLVREIPGRIHHLLFGFVKLTPPG